MELKRAKEVLCFADRMNSTQLLFESVYNDCSIYACAGQRIDEAELHGKFSPDQLIAIATWMRDPEGVVKA